MRTSRLVGKLLLEEPPLTGLGQSQTRIPIGMLGVPQQRLRRLPFHHNFRHQIGELTLERSDPAISQDDVRVENLPRFGIHTARTDRCTFIIVQPSDEIVSYVLRRQLHVFASLLVLLPNLNRIRDTNLLERLVPI